MSSARLRKIGEDGVTFRSHLDGSAYLLDARSRSRRSSAPNVTMALDECTPYPVSRECINRKATYFGYRLRRRVTLAL
jgi:queuine tRNA-ribosyltransferase